MKFALLLLSCLCAALCVSAQVNRSCPKIIVDGPVGVTSPGETMTFKATADSALPSGSKFNWTVSAGEIISGQGTSTITVKAPPDGNVDSVHATVRVVGPSTACSDVFSADAAVQLRPFVCGLAPDDYPKLTRNEQRARLANAASMWKANPGTVLVFVLYLAANENRATAQRRAQFIRDFFHKDRIGASGQLHVPSDSLRLLFANSEDTHTAVYLLPPEEIASFAKSFEASLKIEDIRPFKK